MRTAIYARFSSQLQKDSSIEDQVRVCVARAEREGWQLTRVFSDFAISGAVRDRPGLNDLIAHVQAGHADVVLAEAIDRLSRDQEDLAGIYKRIRFAGASIVTLSEGTVDELQIGFKGTMASLFRKDLADKIRRGQTGRVAAGRIPGGLVYGYRKVARFDGRGNPELGLREIDPQQAAVVRRIYREYLAGESPLAIARRLNAEGVPSPSGRKWNVSAINGDTVRGNGILCNAIYVGELVYNRTTMVRDPDTRKRVPRVNPPDQWQRVEVPDLAIVDRSDWDAVRDRKAEWSGWSYRQQRRPARLLSGLLQCGRCGSNMVIDGGSRYACSGASRRGTCNNHRTIVAESVERRVLAGLERQLLDPQRVARVVKAYHEQRNHFERETAAAGRKHRSRVAEIDRQIERLVGAIADGAGEVPEVVSRLQQARQEREQLLAAMGEDAAAASVITLHPNIAEAYAKAVHQITAVIAGDGNDAREAKSAMRALVDRIILTPKVDKPGMDIEVEGRLAAMLELGQGKNPTPARNCTVVVVAEERSGLSRTLSRIRV
jgi:site-specific DNA recombinase